MNTRKLRKALLTLCSALLLVSLSVGITVAYLTDTDVVTNTFTVGNVSLVMHEAYVDEMGNPAKPVEVQKKDENGQPVVDEDGNPVMETVDQGVDYADAERVQNNDYKLYPGHTYLKDPTIVVGDTCDLAYLRVVVKFVGGEALQDLNLPMEEIFTRDTTTDWQGTEAIWGWNDKENNPWNIVMTVEGNDVVYTLTANDYIDRATPHIELFDHVNIPGGLTNAQMDKLNNLQMEIKAYAVQADGFQTEAGILADAETAFSTAFPELWGAE